MIFFNCQHLLWILLSILNNRKKNRYCFQFFFKVKFSKFWSQWKNKWKNIFLTAKHISPLLCSIDFKNLFFKKKILQKNSKFNMFCFHIKLDFFQQKLINLCSKSYRLMLILYFITIRHCYKSNLKCMHRQKPCENLQKHCKHCEKTLSQGSQGPIKTLSQG